MPESTLCASGEVYAVGRIHAKPRHPAPKIPVIMGKERFPFVDHDPQFMISEVGGGQGSDARLG